MIKPKADIWSTHCSNLNRLCIKSGFYVKQLYKWLKYKKIVITGTITVSERFWMCIVLFTLMLNFDYCVFVVLFF